MKAAYIPVGRWWFVPPTRSKKYRLGYREHETLFAPSFLNDKLKKNYGKIKKIWTKK